MSSPELSRGMRRKLIPILIIASMAVATSACTGGIMDQEPPEAVYTEAEAFAPMEAEVADIVASLPDFPGFYTRSWNEMVCSHNGIDNGDYVNIEIRYGFADADAATGTVRNTYVSKLRERWTDLGYEIRRDEASGTGKDYSLEARRDDGINLWYSVATKVTLYVQSGCVPKSDPSEIEYIAPTGGVDAGSQRDNIRIDGFEGMPEAPSETATDPFQESSPTGMVPWAREPDGSETGPSSYEGQL